LSPEIFGYLSGINEISARLALPNRSASQDILENTSFRPDTNYRQLTSNSKTTNQMTQLHCPFFRSKPIIVVCIVAMKINRYG
jgi:hypothetical protein